jgi:hypothetical protein
MTNTVNTANQSSVYIRVGDKFRVTYRCCDPATSITKNTCKRGFKLKREAKDWIATELPSIIEALEQKRKTISTMTMDELIEEYLFYKKMHVRITTFETKKHIIETKILPYFAGRLVVDIEPYDIMQWQHHPVESQRLVKETVVSNKGKEKVVKSQEYYSDTYLRAINNQLFAIFKFSAIFL